MVSIVSQDHLEISLSASALTSASALQKFYFAIRSFDFCLTRYIMKQNIHDEVLFIALAGFSCSLEQLFCRQPVNACFWRKELHHERYFRSFKNTWSFSLQVCKFLIKSLSRDHFLKILCKFEIAWQTVYCQPAYCILYTVYCILFWNIPCTCWISRKSCKTQRFLLLY